MRHDSRMRWAIAPFAALLAAVALACGGGDAPEPAATQPATEAAAHAAATQPAPPEPAATEAAAETSAPTQAATQEAATEVATQAPAATEAATGTPAEGSTRTATAVLPGLDLNLKANSALFAIDPKGNEFDWKRAAKSYIDAGGRKDVFMFWSSLLEGSNPEEDSQKWDRWVEEKEESTITERTLYYLAQIQGWGEMEEGATGSKISEYDEEEYKRLREKSAPNIYAEPGKSRFVSPKGKEDWG